MNRTIINNNLNNIDIDDVADDDVDWFKSFFITVRKQWKYYKQLKPDP